MGAVKYIPQVACVKCDKPVTDVRRVFSPEGGGRRYIEARCHGETVELSFADDTETVVKVFAP
jgi:hypothetical protein